MENLKIEKLHPELLKKADDFFHQLILCLAPYIGKPFESYDDFIETIKHDFSKRLTKFIKADSEYFELFLAQTLYDLIFVESAMTLASVLYGKLKPSYYVINKEFHAKFQKTKLANIRFKHLPKNQAGYIHLPTPVQDSDGTEFSDVYFFCGDDSDYFPIGDYRRGGDDILKEKNRDYGSKILKITLLSEPSDESEMASQGEIRDFSIRFPKDEERLIAEDIEQSKDIHTGNFEVQGDTLILDPEHKIKHHGYPNYIKAVINLLLYISSGEPDIREFKNKPLKLPGQRRQKVLKSETLSHLDLKIIGFSWKKERIFHVDGTIREEHFYWQAYGHNWSLHRWRKRKQAFITYKKREKKKDLTFPALQITMPSGWAETNWDTYGFDFDKGNSNIIIWPLAEITMDDLKASLTDDGIEFQEITHLI